MGLSQKKSTASTGKALALSTVAAALAMAAFPWARRTWQARAAITAAPDGCHPPNACTRRRHDDAAA